LVFTADVIVALEDDVSLTEDVRTQAIARARSRGDEASRLNTDSWHLVRFAGGDPEAYKIGLRGAEAAVRSEPDAVHFLNTLGLAQYRNGRYEQVHATMMRSDTLRRQLGLPTEVSDVAVLAMALHKLQRTQEAQAMFERLKLLMSAGVWSDDEEATTFFEECEQLVKGSGVQHESTERNDIEE